MKESKRTEKLGLMKNLSKDIGIIEKNILAINSDYKEKVKMLVQIDTRGFGLKGTQSYIDCDDLLLIEYLKKERELKENQLTRYLKEIQIGFSGQEQMAILDEDQIEDLIELGYVPIATAKELQHISYNDDQPRTFGQGTKWEGQYVGKLDSKFIQVKDIDLSSIPNFKPIGNDSIVSGSFAGTYNGGNYKVTGLDINKPNKDFVGLFGYTSGATIENVGLENVNVVGRMHTGGLAGMNIESTIDNSYATGSVTGRESTGGLVGRNFNSDVINSYATGSVTGTSCTGGLVGNNLYNATISNSYAKVNVTGEDEGLGRIGGLVGMNNSSATIINSYATGSVRGGEGHTGGLVGHNVKSTIENSYAKGSVKGEELTGGLVGGNYKSDIINSYATGSVDGTWCTGGLVGDSVRATDISNSYYDTNTTGLSKSDGGTGLTTEQMKDKNRYNNWGFEDSETPIWKITPGSYPTLIDNPED